MLSTIYHFSLIQAFKVQSIKQHVIFFPGHGLFESWLKVTQDFNFSLESAYKTHLKRLQSKQNIVLRLLTFFATTSGPQTESALPFLNLLDALTVNDFYRLHALKLSLRIHGIKGIYQAWLTTFSNMLVLGIHTTQGMHRSNTPVNCVLVLTLENKLFPIQLSGNRPLAWYPLLLKWPQYIFFCQRNKTLFTVRKMLQEIWIVIYHLLRIQSLIYFLSSLLFSLLK